VDENKKHNKLDALIANGYEFTGKNYKVTVGDHKGKEFPVYAMKGDIAGLVYNNDADRIELVFKLTLPFSGCQAKTTEAFDKINKLYEKGIGDK